MRGWTATLGAAMKIKRNRPWSRFHDPGKALLESVPEVDYPTCLADLIELCRKRPGGDNLHAAASYWALSETAISDQTLIEKHEPKGHVAAMEKTLFDVMPGYIKPNLLEHMKVEDWPKQFGLPIHVESGKRIYQLYAELDQEQEEAGNNVKSMAKVILETMGNADGQTVVGLHHRHALWRLRPPAPRRPSRSDSPGSRRRPPLLDRRSLLHCINRRINVFRKKEFGFISAAVGHSSCNTIEKARK